MYGSRHASVKRTAAAKSPSISKVTTPAKPFIWRVATA